MCIRDRYSLQPLLSIVSARQTILVKSKSKGSQKRPVTKHSRVVTKKRPATSAPGLTANENLRRELAEARSREEATSEILGIIARSRDNITCLLYTSDAADERSSV